jgi:hypothetical protein
VSAQANAIWLDSPDYPGSPTPANLKEFFGIPPSPDDDESLSHNIREKRKTWKKKRSHARTGEALKMYDSVLQAIAEAEDYLKRGAQVDPSIGGTTTAAPTGSGPSVARTIDEIWEQIERLLFRGRYREALDRLEDHEALWGAFARFVELRSVVVLSIVQNDPSAVLGSTTLARAIADAERAVAELGPNESRFTLLIDLLDAAGRTADADETFARALKIVERPTATFRARQLSILSRESFGDSVLRLAIELVAADPTDRAIRSDVVQVLVKIAISKFLPIDSDEKAESYARIIGVAAWAAQGVPEAEDFVRPHRMWAANARQPIFAGNWQWRAFFAIVTGFISLPIHNAMQSKSAWNVLHEGPPAADASRMESRMRAKNRAWFMVTRNSYIEAVHDGVRLPWQSSAGAWISVEPVFNF